MLPLLALLPFFTFAVLCASIPVHTQRDKPSFAPACGTTFNIHDPAIIKVAGTYYAYSVGENILIHKAPDLSGPWKHIGSVLEKDSVIQKGDRKAPWAPSVIYANGKFYCYYSVSQSGSRDSAIGVASSLLPGPDHWKDHGAIIFSGSGEGSTNRPFDRSNAIDPSIAFDDDDKAYLNFGSFWTGIWQVALNDDLVSFDNETETRHLASQPGASFSGGPKDIMPLKNDPTGPHPIEGAFISHTGHWYYLWFSHGKCCEGSPKDLPPPGDEYSIRVGRSKSPRGPFVDRKGNNLLDGGGEIVYGSNRDVYAPGGQQVLKDGDTDVLYYHYLNTTIGYNFDDAFLGYNPLKYVDGWPVAV